jgi:hypothetical protein
VQNCSSNSVLLTLLTMGDETICVMLPMVVKANTTLSLLYKNTQ